MKRHRFFLTALALMLSVFCACSENVGIEKGGSSLCAWFDGIGMKEDLSQQSFVSLLDGYSIDGRALTDVAPYAFFENAYGSGCSGSCSSFSYGREESVGKYTMTVSYLTFSSEIDGVVLPYGIEIGDSLSTVLTAFGYPEQFSFLNDGEAAKLLSEKEGEELMLRNLEILSSETAYLYPYQLLYTEFYTVTGSDGGQISVDRSLDLYFSKGSDPTLSMVRILVSEEQ